MAEAIITHFHEFRPDKVIQFSQAVFEAVGLVVYDIPPEEITTKDITLVVVQAGPGSCTSATAGTEVKVDLDDEEWPLNAHFVKESAEAAKQNCLRIKQALGVALLGGVEKEQGAIVNVWVRQFVATGWYGDGYQD